MGGKVLPWLIVGWIMFGDKLRSGRAPSSTSTRAPQAPPPTGFLYRLPDDGYETARMALALDGAPPREVGIFSNPGEARKVAAAKGWVLAPEVRELKARP